MQWIWSDFRQEGGMLKVKEKGLTGFKKVYTKLNEKKKKKKKRLWKKISYFPSGSYYLKSIYVLTLFPASTKHCSLLKKHTVQRKGKKNKKNNQRK